MPLHGAPPADPLPVFKVGGIVRLNLVDLNGWLLRQRDNSLGELSRGFAFAS